MKIIDRFGALSGAAYVLLVGVGNVMGTPPGPQPDHPTGQQDLDALHWLAGNPAAQAGVSLELLGFAAWILFVGYLCTRVRAGGWLAGAALVGGAVSVAVKVGSGAPAITAYLLRNEIPPETARVLTDLNGVAFVVDMMPAGLFVACAAGAAMATHTLGRVLGWGGVTAGVVAVISTAATGLHIDSVVAVPFLLCLLWILLVSFRLGLSRRRASVPVAAELAEAEV
jgi:hypothetical protein